MARVYYRTSERTGVIVGPFAMLFLFPFLLVYLFFVGAFYVFVGVIWVVLRFVAAFRESNGNPVRTRARMIP